jgi:hypothetical protein
MKFFVCVIKGHELQWVLSRSKTAIAVAMRNEKLLKKLFAGCDTLRKKSGSDLVALTPINVELIKLFQGPLLIQGFLSNPEKILRPHTFPVKRQISLSVPLCNR